MLFRSRDLAPLDAVNTGLSETAPPTPEAQDSAAGEERRERRTRDRYGRDRRGDRPGRESGVAMAPEGDIVIAPVAATPASTPAERVAMPSIQSYTLPVDSLVAVAQAAQLEWVQSDSARVAQIQAAIAAERADTGPRYRCDDACAARYATNPVVASVRDVDVPSSIQEDARRLRKASAGCRPPIAAKRVHPCASDGADNASSRIDSTDARIIVVRDEYVPRRVQKDVVGSVQLSACRWNAVAVKPRRAGSHESSYRLRGQR